VGVARAQQPANPPLPPPTQEDGTGRIDIFGAGANRMAVPACLPRTGDGASREACQTIAQVLRRDLEFENLFQFVSDAAISALPPANPDAPNFADWRSVGATYVAMTRAQVTGATMVAELRVFFVPSGQVVLSRRYEGSAENPRIYAHQASDEIVAATGQTRGVARTRIAFSTDRDADARHRTKELYVMDYDGFNPRRMTVNRTLNILPNWSPDGRSLAYTSYRQGTPDVFTAAIYEGRSANLTKGQGQNFAPAWSPDGTKIAYSSSRGGNSDIYVANADGTGARKLTTSPASDTAPAWSPTGSEIAFTSNRTGNPQIYLMDTEGLNVRRLTTVGNYNDGPAWNPNKQFTEIAYTSRLDGGFEVAVVDLATRQVRQITQGRGSCEYPSWAPSGRHLVFSCQRRGGTWQITVADRTGARVSTISAGPGNNVQPDWSP
jgi:TolB protein